MNIRRWSTLALVCALSITARANACVVPEGYIPVTTKQELEALRTCFGHGPCPSDENGPYNDRNYFIVGDINLGGAPDFRPIITQFRGKLEGCSTQRPVLRNLRISSNTGGYVGLFAQLAGAASVSDLVFEDFDISSPGNSAVIAAQVTGNARINRVEFRKSGATAQARVRSAPSGAGGNAALIGAFVQAAGGPACSILNGNVSAACLRISQIDIPRVPEASEDDAFPRVEALRGNAGGIVARMAEGLIADVEGGMMVSGYENAAGIVASLFPDATIGARIEDARLSVQVRSLEALNVPCYASGLPCGDAGGLIGSAIGPVGVVRSAVRGTVHGHYYAGGLAGKITSPLSFLENVYVHGSVRQIAPTQIDPTEGGAAAGLVAHGSGLIRVSYVALQSLLGIDNRVSALVHSSPDQLEVEQSFYDQDLMPADVSGLLLGVGLPTIVMQSTPEMPDFPFMDWEFDLWSFEAGLYPSLVDIFLCRADFDQNGFVSVEDLFAFLSGWFAGDPRADFNDDGQIAVVDIFAFLTSWFGARAANGSC